MNRPLSPHLHIYRFPWSSVLSITHRITGIALSVGFFALVFWLWALAEGPATFQQIQRHTSAWYGQLCLIGWSFSLFYHMAAGIRHLIGDTGCWLGLKAAYRSGIAAVCVAFGLTLLTWLYIGYGG